MVSFAVMTFMYQGQINGGDITHEQLIDLVAESGATGIEAFHQIFLDDADLVKRYLRAMPAAGVSMPVIDVIVNLCYGTQAERSEKVDQLRRGLDVCAELGAEIAHVAGSRLPEGMAPVEGRKCMAELLGEHGDYAAERGLVLAIEDFDPAPDLVCKGADCMAIMAASGHVVKLVFDTGNFQAVHERADEQLDALYPHIAHCHFKDFVLSDSATGYSGTVFGSGIIPNQAVATELQRRGYNGWVALESYVQNGAGPRQTIPREMTTLKAMFAV